MRTGWLAALFVVTASSAAWAQPRVAPPCDRACLEGYVDRYLDAMLANDVSPKLFARDVKFTENGIRLPLGNEGLWFGMSGRGKYKFYVPDIETQQIAFIGTIVENTATRGANTGQGNLVAIALRLKVVGGLIAEVEQLAIRPDTGLGGARGGGARGGGAAGGAAAGGARAAGAGAPAAGAGARGAGGDAAAAAAAARGAGAAAPAGAVPAAGGAARGAGAAPGGAGAVGTGDRVEAMGSPHPIFAEVIPEAKRPSREQLIETANYYFTGLARNDGKGYYPFTDDCERFENGISTTQRNCKAQFENTLRGVVSRIRDRRFVAVDRERGIVFAFAFFDHEQINWTWQLGELFKIENGLIRRVEAVFHRAPYGIPSGWSTFELAMSEAIQSVR
jgi:hypothetical protein